MQENFNLKSSFIGRRNVVTAYANTGAIHFDYGMETIKFGMPIEEAEANFILKRLKKAGVLTAAHFRTI